MKKKPNQFDTGLIPSDRYRTWHQGDPTPLCLCGCGLTVSWVRKNTLVGYPRNYKRGHHPNITQEAAVRSRQDIPIEDFRRVVHEYRLKRGMRVNDIADLAGLSWGHFNSIMYSKDRHSVGKKWAEDFFSRLAGRPTVPTVYQKRLMEEEKKIEKQLDKEFAIR